MLVVSKPPPTLRPKVVTNDQALREAIDAALAHDPELETARRTIEELRDRLREVLTHEQRVAYELLCEAEAAHREHAALVLVTWAFTAGQKNGHG